MSDPQTPAADSATASIEQDISTVAGAVGAALPIVQAVVTALAPEAAAAASVGVTIAKGVIAGLPEAINLWNQFTNGQIPTQAELDTYQAQELTAYNAVMADIQAKLAPPAV